MNRKSYCTLLATVDECLAAQIAERLKEPDDKLELSSILRVENAYVLREPNDQGNIIAIVVTSTAEAWDKFVDWVRSLNGVTSCRPYASFG